MNDTSARGTRLFNTQDDVILLILRLAIGIVILPHGAQKLLGAFGGYGPDGTLAYFASLGIPTLLGWLAIIAEFFGGLALIGGFLGRIAAFGTACVMVVAVMTTHINVGFFMNWGGQLKGEGFEYHILFVAIALVIMIRGSGAASLDGLIAQRIERTGRRIAATRTT
ncbi:MAG TPA: DoxX family protein [Candidatus Kapabacteria bacterium]|nr:DoxX family protein [Candidatus Kapabacteria bacterium]